VQRDENGRGKLKFKHDEKKEIQTYFTTYLSEHQRDSITDFATVEFAAGHKEISSNQPLEVVSNGFFCDSLTFLFKDGTDKTKLSLIQSYFESDTKC
jgi:hypothetical protein